MNFKSCMLRCLRVPVRPIALAAVRGMTKRDIKRARIDAFFKRVDLPEGEKHTFVNEHPFAKNSVKAIEMTIAFIKKHGSGQQHAAVR